MSLDGAVNPEALEARKRGALVDYVVAKRLPYIIDRAGAVDFMREPRIAARYEILVHDTNRDLRVLRLEKRTDGSGESDAPEGSERPADAAHD